MEELYQRYLEMREWYPQTKGHDIYNKGWCVWTGRSCISPHPHRHYTFNEFKEEYEKNSELQYYLNN